jgi:hypothetical protein
MQDQEHPIISQPAELDALRPGAVVMAYATPYIKLSKGKGLWQNIDGTEHAADLFHDGPVHLLWTAGGAAHAD